MKPEAVNEARREIARNAPPQQRFSQKNETITKNNEAKRKIPDGQMKFAKVRSCFLRGLLTILGKKDKKIVASLRTSHRLLSNLVPINPQRPHNISQNPENASSTDKNGPSAAPDGAMEGKRTETDKSDKSDGNGALFTLTRHQRKPPLPCTPYF